tara:strand:- start:542 stop:925 length:384 start_codon:yes stop_codon:yes gene_type:complete
MDLIIKESTFDIKRVKFKKGKKVTKILYDLDFIIVIGITLKIEGYNYNETYNYLFLNIKDSPQLSLLMSIDTFFKKNLEYYQSFINKNTIRVKKHKGFKNCNKLLYITLNSLKEVHDKFYKVQIFTI